MKDGNNKFKLIKTIIGLSQSKDWDSAKLEWELIDINKLKDSDLETCICGHYPISEVCEMKNRINGNIVNVGNICVNKFINKDLGTNKIFQSCNRIISDNTKSVNKESIEYFYKKGIISEKDKDFYINIWRKRNTSLKPLQSKRKIDINQKILKKYFYN